MTSRDNDEVFYVVRTHDSIVEAERQYSNSVTEWWERLWTLRWWLVGFLLACLLVATVYLLNAQSWYRAYVVLAKSEQPAGPTLGGNVAGLIGLAGISLGQENGSESLAILRSREFTRHFIFDRDILDDLLEEARFGQDADIRDAVRFFEEEVRSVREDQQTGLITVTVVWPDPEVAAEWANQLILRVNAKLRARALDEAQRNIGYLEEQIQAATLVSMRQALSELLQNELKKLMLAKGNGEFAFRVIDPAVAPKKAERPRAFAIVGVAFFIGLFVPAMAIAAVSWLRDIRVCSDQ